MKIAVTGASGFLGQPVCASLRTAGHTVVTVGRARGSGNAPNVIWDPVRGMIDSEGLSGVEGVVHLAGAPIAQRWTDTAKREIRESRVAGTTLLAASCAALRPPPKVLVSMSGIGIYGDCGEAAVTEATPAGSGFLAEVAQAWERAAEPARRAGVRVLHPRLGIVLHRSGGALAKLIPIFSLGLGGRIADGRQWMPWIARDDAVRVIAAMVTGELLLEGPVNLVAPQPSTNAEFTIALGKALRRPAVLPVPAFAVRAAFGEMGAETVLGGQRALPNKLREAGYSFLYPTLAEALRAALT